MLYDDSKQCVIIDPGCSNDGEEKQLSGFIEGNQLKPVLLLNTHCHIDHILGNAFVAEKYQVPLYVHHDELMVLGAGAMVAGQYGFSYRPSPKPYAFLDEGEQITFGNTFLEILNTPGHSPGGVCFVNRSEKVIIAGDVLFQGSIGRTDLPGGNFSTLEDSIRKKLYTLDDDFTVYSGHGPETSIGQEKKHNPFIRASLSF